MRKKRLLRMLMFAPLGLLFVALLGFLFMSLWNWLVPPIFGWSAIGYWQAFGLFILSKLIFGGFHGSRGGAWRHRMVERCERMTPEEREKFRQAFESRWGRVTPPDPKASA